MPPKPTTPRKKRKTPPTAHALITEAQGHLTELTEWLGNVKDLTAESKVVAERFGYRVELKNGSQTIHHIEYMLEETTLFIGNLLQLKKVAMSNYDVKDEMKEFVQNLEDHIKTL